MSSAVDISYFHSWRATTTSGSYILTNKRQSVLYIGMTNALSRRIAEHRRREIPGFAARYHCHRLIYFEHYVDQAIARETQLKKWSRSKKVALIATKNPAWLDLGKTMLGVNE